MVLAAPPTSELDQARSPPWSAKRSPAVEMSAHNVGRTKENGLDCVKLTHSSGASALVYVYGAHLASWQTSDGDEQLFVSSTAEYGGGKAIRGGVPICWPQFAGRGSGPKHGVCRNSAEWQVVRTSSEPYPCVAMSKTRSVWPRGPSG